MNKKILLLSSNFLIIVTFFFVCYVIILSLFWIGSIFDIEQGEWTTLALLHIFCPITTAAGIVLIVLPCYILNKIHPHIKYCRLIWISLASIFIIWVETFISLCLPLGMTK